MTFLEIFEEMHRKDQGVTSGALAGVDGLTVEEWRAPGDDRDLSALSAEIVQFFRESDRIAVENISAGTARRSSSARWRRNISS
jgi:predicted regulator of Ras-like GTPase activity (Roadblock/LC7/MglB family)